jgi:hypothetical protein
MDTILILQSMYPLPDELILSPSTSAAMESGAEDEMSVQEFVCVLRLPLEPVESMDDRKRSNEADKADEVEIKIVIPSPSSGSTTEAQDELARVQPTLKLHQLPSQLVRADVDVLERQFQALQTSNPDGPTNPDPDSDPVEWITTTITSFLPTISHSLSARRLLLPQPDAPSTSTPQPPEPLERCYLWFPSLSTPSKRLDLVTYASRYDLTGFVLAGKPGLLCLEGGSGGFGRYLNDIKNESWSDIPSYQKKVSLLEVLARALRRDDMKPDKTGDTE